jgi:PAS domain S-box-containing protein
MSENVGNPATGDTHEPPQPYQPLHPRTQKRDRRSRAHAAPAARDPTDESRELFEQLFRVSSDGIVLYEVISDTVRGYFLQANDAICRLLGYSVEEMRKLTPLDILAPGEAAKAPGAESVTEHGGILIHEKTLIARDGRRIPVEISTRLFQHGGKRMVLSIIRDITARRQTEEALRESEERFRSFVDNSPAIAWMKDKQGRHVYLSGSYERRFGVSLEDWRGKTDFELWPPETAAEFWKNDREVLRTGRTIEVVEETPAPDGGRCYWWDFKFPFKDASGKTCVGGIGVDITQRKRMEESLRQSEDRLRTFIRQSQDGIIIIDRQGKLTEWNTGEEQITGIPRSQALGQPLWEIQYRLAPREKRTPAFLQTAKERIFNGLKEGVDLKRVLEDEIERPDGARRIVQLIVFTILSGREILAGGICRDITEHKQIEAKLHRLNQELELKVTEQTEELTHTIDRVQDEVAHRVLAEGKLRKHSQMLEGFFLHTITPLAFIDRRFNFVRVNEAYARADGHSPEFFVGKNYFSIYPDEEGQANFEQVVQTRQPCRACARPLPHFGVPPQGEKFWNWQITPLLDDHGDVQYLVFILEDVTEQQAALHELEQRARQLQKLTLDLSQAEDRERKRLADILHDDLQQVLAAAKFHVGLLNGRDTSSDESREIVAQVKQMLADAIEKSRSLSHELSPAFHQVDMGSAFEGLARGMKQKHGLTVHVETRGKIDTPQEALRGLLYKAA